MKTARWEVPSSWKWVQAIDVASIVGGGTPSSKDGSNFAEPGAGIPWIGPADLTGYKGAYIGRGRRDLTERGLSGSGATLMPAGSVLFSSRAPIGYCAIASDTVSTNQGFKSWICSEGVVPEFVRHYLLSSVDYVDSLASGTTFREVSGRRVGEIAFPLAPEAEQRRIVTKLDALTARLARARLELDRVESLVDRFRGPAIRAVFRELFALYGDAAAADFFSWASGKFLPKKAQNGGTIPVYGGNGVNGSHDETNVDVPTLVVGRVGAQCGNVHLTRGPAWVTDNAIYARSISPEIDLQFAYYVFEDANLVQHAAGTGQPYVNQDVLNAVRFPRVDLETQRAVSMRFASAFARADRLEVEAARARALIDRLESAILAKAFRGELVQQDPNDEPASVLLDRIRTAPKPKRGRRAAASA